MSELLIIKVGTDYVRFVGETFDFCPLNKASVFPLAQAEEGKQRCRQLTEAGFVPEIMKLTIVEEPYKE